MLSRTLPPDKIAFWRTRLEEIRGDIDEIAREEREEKAIRKAEMEADKVRTS